MHLGGAVKYASVSAVCCLLLAGIAPAADSLNVRLVGHCDTPKPDCYSVTVSGEYAYVADGGLRVISVADPAHPSEIAHVDSLDYAWAVAVVGDYAYVAVDLGLQVVSVADPTHPAVVGQCDAPHGVAGVAVGGGYAYLADYLSGLRVISVADPTHPVEVGYCDTPGSASGVALAGTCVYVADHDSGLRIISVADPAHPVEIGSTDSTIGANEVALSGDHAYVAYGHDMLVISVADPGHPVEVGRCHLPGAGGARGVAVNGAYAYVAADDGGLRVVSIADPAHPVEVGHYVEQDGKGWPTCVAAIGDYVYVGTTWDGLRVFQFYGAGVAESPKPQAPSRKLAATVLSGASAAKRLASGVVFDAMGRRVLNLRSGVYFVRQQGSRSQGFEDSRVRKVIVTR
jgi:hypothetical protein